MVWFRRTIALLATLLACTTVFVLWERYGPRPSPPITVAHVDQIDHILIEKADRRLTAFRKGQPVLSFEVALGFGPIGSKQVEGDGKTPEGLFHIDRKNPKSAYHLSLGLDYPQPADIERARKNGTSPGGDIFIHGQPNGLGRLATLPGDWTAGCVAVSNPQMEQLWQLTALGTSVEIHP